MTGASPIHGPRHLYATDKKRWIPTSPLHLQVLQYCGFPQSTIPIFTAAHTHHVSIVIYSFFSQTQFFGPFPRTSGAHDSLFRIPLLALHTLKFFPPLHLDSRFWEAADTYLQRHPYTNTYYVNTTSSSAFHKVSSFHYLLFFFQNNILKNFLSPFPWFSPIFEFPFSRYILSDFFPPLHLNSTHTG